MQPGVSDSACAEKVTTLHWWLTCGPLPVALAKLDFLVILLSIDLPVWEGSCQARPSGGLVYLCIPINEHMHLLMLLLEKDEHCIALLPTELTLHIILLCILLSITR